VIPEPQNPIAARHEEFRARFVRCDTILFSMSAAIDFNNYFAIMTGKVCEIRSDGRLTAKVGSFDF